MSQPSPCSVENVSNDPVEQESSFKIKIKFLSERKGLMGRSKAESDCPLWTTILKGQ